MWCAPHRPPQVYTLRPPPFEAGFSAPVSILFASFDFRPVFQLLRLLLLLLLLLSSRKVFILINAAVGVHTLALSLFPLPPTLFVVAIAISESHQFDSCSENFRWFPLRKTEK